MIVPRLAKMVFFF